MPAYDNNVKTAFCEMFSAENSISIIEKVSKLAGIFKDKNLINNQIIKILKDMEHPDMKIMDFCLFFYGKHLNDLKNK